MRGKGISQRLIMAISLLLLPLETILAKEAKSRNALRRKTPRLSIFGADRGLQYGLSGNRVLERATLKLID